MFPHADRYITGEWINAWTAAGVATVFLILLPLVASELVSRRLRISGLSSAIVCLLGAGLMVAGVAWIAYGGPSSIDIQDRSIAGSYEKGQWPLIAGLLVYIVGIVTGMTRRGPHDAASGAYMLGFLGAIHSVLLVNIYAVGRGLPWDYSQGPWKTFMLDGLRRWPSISRFPDWMPDSTIRFWPDLAPQAQAAHWFGDYNEFRNPESLFLVGSVVGVLPFIVIGAVVLALDVQFHWSGNIPGGVIAIGAAIPLVAGRLRRLLVRSGVVPWHGGNSRCGNQPARSLSCRQASTVRRPGCG